MDLRRPWREQASGHVLDPLGFDAGDSNLYRYVNNSPIQNLDPTGKALYAYSQATANDIKNWLERDPSGNLAFLNNLSPNVRASVNKVEISVDGNTVDRYEIVVDDRLALLRAYDAMKRFAKTQPVPKTSTTTLVSALESLAIPYAHLQVYWEASDNGGDINFSGKKYGLFHSHIFTKMASETEDGTEFSSERPFDGKELSAAGLIDLLAGYLGTGLTPVTKQRFEQLIDGANNNILNKYSEGARNDLVGELFERVSGGSLGLPSNSKKYKSDARSARLNGKVVQNIPDFVRPYAWMERRNGKIIARGIIPEGDFIEVKAFSIRQRLRLNTIQLSTQDWEILGYLDILENLRTNAVKTRGINGVALSFVTTSDDQIGGRVILEARRRHVNVFQTFLFEDRQKTSRGEPSLTIGAFWPLHAPYASMARNLANALNTGSWIAVPVFNRQTSEWTIP